MMDITREIDETTVLAIDAFIKEASAKYAIAKLTRGLKELTNPNFSPEILLEEAREHSLYLKAPVPESDPAKKWLLQSRNTGVFMAVNFFNQTDQSSSLLASTQSHLEQIF